MEKGIDYYTYANDDYHYLEDCINAGIFRSSMASIAQNTCERYLKSIIADFTLVEENSRVMRTHSLKTLLNYVLENLPDFKIDYAIMLQADGLYITSWYPGKHLALANKETILLAFESVKETKRAVDDYLHAHTNGKGPLRELDLF